jgi:hypothetical protein
MTEAGTYILTLDDGTRAEATLHRGTQTYSFVVERMGRRYSGPGYATIDRTLDALRGFIARAFGSTTVDVTPVGPADEAMRLRRRVADLEALCTSALATGLEACE